MVTWRPQRAFEAFARGPCCCAVAGGTCEAPGRAVSVSEQGRDSRGPGRGCRAQRDWPRPGNVSGTDTPCGRSSAPPPRSPRAAAVVTLPCGRWPLRRARPQWCRRRNGPTRRTVCVCFPCRVPCGRRRPPRMALREDPGCGRPRGRRRVCVLVFPSVLPRSAPRPAAGYAAQCTAALPSSSRRLAVDEAGFLCCSSSPRVSSHCF